MFAVVIQDPLPVVEYAKRHHLTETNPFKDVCKHMVRYPLSLLSRVFEAKTSPNLPKFKFGVRVPQGTKQAMMLDRQNADGKWAAAIKTEINQLGEYGTFETLESEEKVEVGYKRIPYHIVYDFKFDLRHKARLVANGNWTEAVREDIYSGVVAMYSTGIGFVLGDLNGLIACAGDVGNAYLNSTTKERVYLVAGLEFGQERMGKPLIVRKALYGLKTSAARFHNHLSNTLLDLDTSRPKEMPASVSETKVISMNTWRLCR